MLTQEEDIDAHALFKQGWTISAIARHLDRDRKTIRAHLNGERVAGVRARPAGGDWFDDYVGYVRQRLTDDPHLWAMTLFDELVERGFDRSYPTLTRLIRDRGLRPACEACRPAKGRPVAVIEHPPGEEVQWDWLELPNPPAAWGWAKAYLLVGALSHSGRWRGWLAESTDQAHLIDGLDRITRELGGTPKVWRFDRMTTVCHPDTGRVTATFAGAAKHYGVQVAICPPRRGNRKGVVEKANHTAAQRWWRTVADDATIADAQAALSRFSATRSDSRRRVIDGQRATVAEHAAREPLRPAPPAAYAAQLRVERHASAQALVAFRGNTYSVPPELAHATVVVIATVGSPILEIATMSQIVIARHRRAADGAGVSVRDHGHVIALDHAAMTAATTAAPHRRKQRLPPSPAALAAAAHLPNPPQKPLQNNADRVADAGGVVIDLDRYAQAAAGRNTLTQPEGTTTP